MDNFKVENNDNELRLVDFLVGKFQETMTRSASKKIVKSNRIEVNGVQQGTPYIPKVGDEIVLLDSFDNPPKPYHLRVDVLAEDDDFAVVWKPAGLSTSGNMFKTLEATLTLSVSESQSSDKLPWPRVAHRLDAPTSGVVLVAKTYTALRSFKEAFATNRISKEYHAIIQGKHNDIIVIEEPIDGKESKSELVPVRSVESLKSGFLSLVQLKPITGRTHQLRKHCAFLGTPILGDRLYGDPNNNLLHKGLFLSSTRIKFVHPVSKEIIEVIADIPSKFLSLLDREERRWNKFN